MEPEPKPDYQSKIILANVVTLIVVALTAIAGSEVFPQEYIPWINGAITILNAVGNILLRYVTNGTVFFSLAGKPKG